MELEFAPYARQIYKGYYTGYTNLFGYATGEGCFIASIKGNGYKYQGMWEANKPNGIRKEAFTIYLLIFRTCVFGQ